MKKYLKYETYVWNFDKNPDEDLRVYQPKRTVNNQGNVAK